MTVTPIRRHKPPQWSLALQARKTRNLHEVDAARARAAMEPGPSGQEDASKSIPLDFVSPAAMEPGPSGQEDEKTKRDYAALLAPQWSLALQARKTG